MSPEACQTGNSAMPSMVYVATRWWLKKSLDWLFQACSLCIWSISSLVSFLNFLTFLLPLFPCISYWTSLPLVPALPLLIPSAHSCTLFLQSDTAVLPAVTFAPSTRINHFSLNTVQGRAISLMALTCISRAMLTGLPQASWVTLAKLLNVSVCQVLSCKMSVMDLLQDGSLSDCTACGVPYIPKHC